MHSPDLSGLPDTTESLRLWEFIESEPSLIALETAVYLGRPAVEGIQRQLSSEFPDLMNDNVWRRVAGKIIRRVLEARGYQHKAENVPLRKQEPFKEGSTYTFRN